VTPLRVKLGRIFGQGIVLNVLNPKAALFFFAFLPQFVDASRGHVASRILFLGALFALLGLTTDTFWAISAGTVANLFRRNARAMRTQRYISGGMLISLEWRPHSRVPPGNLKPSPFST